MNWREFEGLRFGRREKVSSIAGQTNIYNRDHHTYFGHIMGVLFFRCKLELHFMTVSKVPEWSMISSIIGAKFGGSQFGAISECTLLEPKSS